MNNHQAVLTTPSCNATHSTTADAPMPPNAQQTAREIGQNLQASIPKSERNVALSPYRYHPNIHPLGMNDKILTYLHPDGISFKAVAQPAPEYQFNQTHIIKNWNSGLHDLHVRPIKDNQGNTVWMATTELGLKGGAPKLRVNVSGDFSITYWKKETQLSYEPDETHHYIHAYVNNERQELRFAVRAQKAPSLGSGKDMVGSLFLRLAQEGISYSTIKAHWSTDDDSVNTEQFKYNLSQGMSRTEAAQNTWTGKLLKTHGWEVSSIESNSDQTSTYVFFK